MPYTDLFPTLPDDAKCWIYAADRMLGDDEQRALLNTLHAFLEGWASHGRPVQGDAAVLQDRFLIVAGLVPDGELSGCGIDASVHAVNDAASALGLAWLSPLRVFFRDADDAVQVVSRGAFRRMVRDGAVTAETPVFDVSVTHLGKVRGGAFALPAGEAWHARVFRIPTAAAAE